MVEMGDGLAVGKFLPRWFLGGDEGASLSLQVICAPAQWSGSGVLGTVQQFGSLCAHLFVHSANI